MFKTIAKKILNIQDKTDKKFLKMDALFNGDDDFESGVGGAGAKKNKGNVKTRDRGMQTLTSSKAYGNDK